jgi:hypothetical protein
MIANFGNLTLVARVEFPKLAIMSSGPGWPLPNPHRGGQASAKGEGCWLNRVGFPVGYPGVAVSAARAFP